MVSQLPLTIAEARTYPHGGGASSAIRGVYACYFQVSTSFCNVSCTKLQCFAVQDICYLYTRELFLKTTMTPVENLPAWRTWCNQRRKSATLFVVFTPKYGDFQAARSLLLARATLR